MRVKYNSNATKFLEESIVVVSHPEKFIGQWRQLIFKNNNPCYLEIGCGKGDFIIKLAHAYPMINFIALERSEPVLMQAVKKTLLLEQLPMNLKFISCDANNLLQIFNPNEIQTIFLNFSDPWPKKRHDKRRLMHPNFLKLYQIILENKSYLYLKTDNETLFNFSTETFATESNWEMNQTAPHHFQLKFISEYERKFLLQNKNIYYLIARLKKQF